MTQTQTKIVATANSSQLTLEVLAKQHVANDVVSLTLASPSGGRLPDWTPGSHVDLVLPTGETRQYSLCGDRWDPYTYHVAILKEHSGRGGSAYLHQELSVGSSLAVGGPRNNFRLFPASSYIFVAGGIGITAIMPMIRNASRQGVPWRLLYLGRSRATMAFLDELKEHGEAVRVVAKDEHGPVDLSTEIGPAQSGMKIYACGPERMLQGLEDHCADWPEGSLRTEHFNAKTQGAPARKEAFDVVLARSGKSITVEPNVSVLDALQEAGTSPLSSCLTGTCGTCEVTVLEGIPDHRDSILTPGERKTSSCMFPCVSRSCDDRLVLDL